MNLEYYKEFAVLASLKNYSEAADQLAVSPSSLSRHIKAMEDELGVTLFDRTTRSIALTKYGRILLPYAEQYISLHQECKRKLDNAKKRAKGTVVVGTSYYIDDLLAQFHIDNSRINILTVSASEDILEMLRYGKCEVAFVTNYSDSKNEFHSLPYETDHYVTVLPQGHRLANRDSISLSELADDNFVSFKANSISDILLKQMCNSAGFEPNIVLNADVGSTIAQLVKKGLGVSILQRKTITKMNPDGTCLVDLEPKIQFNVFLCYRKNIKLSAAAEAFVDYTTKTWPKSKANI